MDILTHAALGAAGAASIAPQREARLAAAAGAVAGMLPDVDILITSSADPLLNLEFHRHFTHSLAFVPLGALVAAGLLWLLLRRRLSFARLYMYAFVGYLLAPLLDACTSYGTHLLWPFAERAVAWNLVSVIDPIYTLLVLIPLAMALFKRSVVPARVSLALAGMGLLVGLVQHHRAMELASQLAAERGHVPERLLVKPTLANMIVWRSLYVHDERIHVDAVRVGLPGSARIYPGENAPRFDAERELEIPAGSRLRHDVERFVAFTDALPVRHPRKPGLIGDARYAMLPTSLEPLWGIVVDPGSPETPVRFETAREMTPEIRKRFVDMLLGRDPDPDTGAAIEPGRDPALMAMRPSM